MRVAATACLSFALMNGCSHTAASSSNSRVQAAGTSHDALNTLVMPATRVAQIKAALPRVAHPRLSEVLASPDTIWYDAETMTPSYQKSTGGSGFWGVQANKNWIHNIPEFLGSDGRQFVNPEKGTWVFPFAATAGTDDATNLHVVNFINFPRTAAGALNPLQINIRNDDSIEAGSRFWEWTYPTQTMVGEVLFVKDAAGNLLPTEIRMRTRYASGWAANVYRPFPTADALAAAVKARRANWAQTPALAALVNALSNANTLTAKGLHAATMKGTFDQDGAVDSLPDFNDDALVHDLLTQTTFCSAYKTAWKTSGTRVTYAPTPASNSLSIVPNNYLGGLIEVSDTSCMRCHKETARLIDNWTDSLVLYGEVWGKDAVFSFHPFDESHYDELTREGIEDNRHLNPNLQAAGVIAAGTNK